MSCQSAFIFGTSRPGNRNPYLQKWTNLNQFRYSRYRVGNPRFKVYCWPGPRSYGGPNTYARTCATNSYATVDYATKNDATNIYMANNYGVNNYGGSTYVPAGNCRHN